MGLIRKLGKWMGKKTSFDETQLLALGKLLSENIKAKQNYSTLFDLEFKIFSQFGDDGIVQWLIRNVQVDNNTFIEFGVANYQESNTRFLLSNDNWSGFVIDGSKSNIKQIKSTDYFWRYDLNVKSAFINKENINSLLKQSGFEDDLGLLHIDLDGNDYWIWEAINCLSPAILILEYNSIFGAERSISVPYDEGFCRSSAHFSNLYFGASLKALVRLSKEKGYSFIGCNKAGNNAYFIRDDKINEKIKVLDVEKGFVMSKFRESRNQQGTLTYLRGDERLKCLKGLPVINTETGCQESL